MSFSPESVLRQAVLVDPDLSRRRKLQFALETGFGWRVLPAADKEEAAGLLQSESFDLLLGDWEGLPLPPPGRKPALVVITDCDGAESRLEQEGRARYLLLGVVSRNQAADGIAEQVNLLAGNSPLAATG